MVGLIFSSLIFISIIMLICGVIILIIYKKRKKRLTRNFSILLIIIGIIGFIPATFITAIFASTSIEEKKELYEEMGPLFLAIDDGDIEELSKHLISIDINTYKRFYIELVKSYRPYSTIHIYHTPLSYATYLNDYKIVEYLLNNGADPNFNLILDEDNERNLIWPPIFFSIYNQNYEIFDLLIKNGANLNIGTEIESAFSLSLKIGDMRLIDKIFYLNQENYLKKDKYNFSYILLLVEDNPDLGILNYIFDNKIDTDINYYEDTTPFIKSIELDNSNEFTLRLYDLGADISKLDEWKMNALFYAGKKNNFEMVKFLVENGISLVQKNYRNETPFFYIATSGCYDKEIKIRMQILNYLIEKGADPNTVDFENMTILERCNNWKRSKKMIENLEKLLEL